MLALYDQDIEQKDIPPGYTRLKHMAKKLREQMIRNRNVEARNDLTATGAAAKRRDTTSGDRKPGDFKLWTTKRKCAKGDSCTFKHDMSKKCKGEGERERTRSPSPGLRSPKIKGAKSYPKRRTSRRTSPLGKKWQALCQKHLKETCTDPSCDHGHPPECQKYETKEGCNYGDKCVILHAEKSHSKPSAKLTME